MTLIVLNISRESAERFDDVCTKEEFEQIISLFPGNVRYEAVNLAAHNWDVVFIEDRLLIASGIRGAWYTQSGAEDKMTEEELDVFYPRLPADDYSTPSITDWVNGAAVKRHREIHLGHLGREGQIFMMVEAIVKDYRRAIDGAHFERANGNFWDDERQIVNNQRSVKRFRKATTETLQKYYNESR